MVVTAPPWCAMRVGFGFSSSFAFVDVLGAIVERSSSWRFADGCCDSKSMMSMPQADDPSHPSLRVLERHSFTMSTSLAHLEPTSAPKAIMAALKAARASPPPKATLRDTFKAARALLFSAREAKMRTTILRTLRKICTAI